MNKVVDDASLVLSKMSDIDILEQLAIMQARESFYFYRRYINGDKLKTGWFVKDISERGQKFYEDLIAGKRPKLAICSPPQHGKSSFVVDLITWMAGKSPDKKAIFASFSERLGVRANLMCQRIYDKDIYKKIFPDTKIATNGESNTFGATRSRELIEYIGKQGYFRNTTVRGSITGESLDIAIIDDAVKGRAEANSQTVRDATWDWLLDDMMTRFSDDAGMLIVMTRWNVDDIVGRLQEEENGNLEVVVYEAIAEEDEEHRSKGEPLFPEHKSLEFLLGIKKVMSSGSWASLYQQRPFVEEGEFFKPDNISIIEEIPVGIRGTRGWDFGATEGDGDFTAGIRIAKMEDGRVLIVDAVRGQWGPDRVRTTLKNVTDRDGRPVKVRIPQDPGQAGKAQAGELTRLLAGYKVEALPVSGDKALRAEGFAAQVNAGNVVMVRGPWNKAFIEELRMFPNGPNDDQIDAAADAFNDVFGEKDKIAMWKKLGK